MGVRKGTDNFKGFREAKQAASFELLRTELLKARRRKMVYPDESALVNDMAERTNIHRTTLIRNSRYHRLLLEFLASQAGGSTLVEDKDAPPELLRAKLIDAQMEIGHLRRELDKARAGTGQPGQPALSSSAAHAAFADTVSVLREVLDGINAEGETMVVDLQRGEIRDLSAQPGRQVVSSGARVRPFIEAYRRLLQQEGRA
jgi:hypothetical protein